jgi:MscS family membrane protein
MKKTIHTCLLVLSVLSPHRAEAQSAPTERPATSPQGEKPPAEDPLGRSTPHGSAIGLVQAAEQGNLDRAAEYLDSRLARSERSELARKLWVVLDRRLVTGISRLSNKPDGDLGDGLSNRDRIGAVESGSGSVDLFLDRVQRGQGDPIWLVSSSTLPKIPQLYDEIGPPWIERYVPGWLQTTRLLSVPLYRWILLVLFIPLVFGSAAISARLVARVSGLAVRRFTRDQPGHTQQAVGPLRVLLLALFVYAASFLGVSLASREFWHRVADTLMVVALCWFSLRLLDVAAELSLKRLERVHRSADTALVRLITRLSKAAALIVAGLVLLYFSDVDLTAALTGLGVGGIAIGFGAQKTIENLFGGIMVISDKPVNVGEVCRAGEFFGTVEDIGIRSTRIRTLDRTVVSVPNGLVSAMSLENFSLRDRILLQHTIALARQTTAEQMRLVLEQIRALLERHPKVEPESARVRFIRFNTGSLDLEIFAYVLEREQPVFLAIQEDLLLGVMDILEASGTLLAVPMAAPQMASG